MNTSVERFIAELSVPPTAKAAADWDRHVGLLAYCLRGIERASPTNLHARALLKNIIASIEADLPIKARVQSIGDLLIAQLETHH